MQYDSVGSYIDFTHLQCSFLYVKNVLLAMIFYSMI